MKKIYLDTNVLLEILFHRERYYKVVSLLLNMQGANFYISVLSVDIVMYFVEIEKQSKNKAWEFLNKYQMLDIGISDVEWAHDNDNGDFEDALQIACARRHKCLQIVTLDQRLEHMYGKYIQIQTIR